MRKGEPMSDLIDRQAAIDAVTEHAKWLWKTWRETISLAGIIEVISNLPSAQPEQPTGVQDILQYLDEYLHPIVSPEHWSVYSELYDMVSMLPSAQPQTVIDQLRWERDVAVRQLHDLGYEFGEEPSAQPEEDCDTCKHGYFGDDQCNNCRVRYPSHYERRTDE